MTATITIPVDIVKLHVHRYGRFDGPRRRELGKGDVLVGSNARDGGLVTGAGCDRWNSHPTLTSRGGWL